MALRKIGLRKAISIFGGENIQLKKGYFYFYGFFDKDGQTYYINSGDLRDRGNGPYRQIMYRKCKDRKDYKGETNLWDFEKILANKGYAVQMAMTV